MKKLTCIIIDDEHLARARFRTLLQRCASEFEDFSLEIIGEAMNRIITRDSSFEEKITNAKAIIGLRNHVIHAYDNVSDENIWAILTNHLPKLKLEIDSLTKE